MDRIDADPREAPLRSGFDTPEARETRARILEAAERLFRVYGYQKTTVGDIAKDLGMSPANVYRFFPSKAAIHEAIAVICTGRVQALATEIVSRDGPAIARLATMIRAIHTYNVEQLLKDKKMHDMVEVAVRDTWGVIRTHIDAMEALFVGLVADGVRRGEFDTDPRFGGGCAFSACVVFFHPQLLEQCLTDGRDKEIEAMIRFIVRALGGDPAKVPAPT